MKVLITGAAGFIGFHLCKQLLEEGVEIVGVDNINDYYDVNLKYDRLNELGIKREDAEVFYKKNRSTLFIDLKFIRLNLEDKEELFSLFRNEEFDVVCNLAAQAGVRYSIENPDVYVQSNIVGFLNILEACRSFSIKHLVYASSSSVYGTNIKIPFEEKDRVDTPVSLYAATKKSNELMAHTYSHLYNMPTTGLRFFTVYGPWGRPDMAPILFANALTSNRSIRVFNNGDMERDFTFIDDIIEGVRRILVSEPREIDLYKIYNIGNSSSVKLMDFIEQLEINFDKIAEKNFLPMQPGDVRKTWANVDELIKDYNYKPEIKINEGVKKFIDWYKNYYKV
ncbi:MULTISPECIES: NAD-dependent epimerase [unclassified Tenacibaculum]|uniref:NAD-dependent epimerase n=1 Tax=unclassified Tenacibaculum TaxID=2635139 RepID=UPI001F4647B2|nr:MULTISPECIES: NAD-dependent epimerase [unclassified Tenacibaculum]MCF2876620.1 NAD-dependent epimerase [Tenacibaculum sp. Cn5-1]MCF2936771.1 NAD-dependent epimerase [Tenacibaculum sp. Cn5-34]MCG7512995.1 NAD-dependent epimerase [Tenacibaculum sp. Cn5-46]